MQDYTTTATPWYLDYRPNLHAHPRLAAALRPAPGAIHPIHLLRNQSKPRVNGEMTISP